MPSARDKRRYPRWAVEGRLTGRFDDIPQVSVVDISLGGTLIEHASEFEPGVVSLLRLAFPGHESAQRCRVVRSDVHRVEFRPIGTQDVIYRTGLEFLESSEEFRGLVDGYIEFLKALLQEKNVRTWRQLT
jgi:hypothetical protein